MSAASSARLSAIALLLFARLPRRGASLGAVRLARVRGSCGDAHGLMSARSAICLARRSSRFFGWPAALLIPLVPAVHALRLFGRLESETDRSWMIFFAGIVLLLPIALGLALPMPPPVPRQRRRGLWGAFVAFYWRAWFGAFGAWVVVALAASRAHGGHARWNPIRALIGRAHSRPTPSCAARRRDAPKPARRRKKRDAKIDAAAMDLALALEPSPEEMPAIDPAL